MESEFESEETDLFPDLCMAFLLGTIHWMANRETVFFTCISEQLYEFHLLMYLLTLHTRLVCLQDDPDQFGVIMHPGLTWHLQLKGKSGVSYGTQDWTS